MEKYFKIIASISFLMILIGCSDNLSREEAKEKINSELQFPIDEIKPIKVEDNTYYANQTAEKYRALKDLGYLNYTFEGVYSSDYHAKAEFTDKGKEFVVSEVRTPGFFKEVDVKVAKIEFGEVTGIKEVKFGDNVTYVVEFTINRKEINPFGKIVYNLKEKTIQKEVKFRKYDDGWRVDDLKDLREMLVYSFEKAEESFF